MTEVIAYLIEHFQDFDNCPPPEDLGRLLEDAGFDATEIGNTLMMMEVLFNTSEFYAEPFNSDSLRVFCREEADNLPQEVMGLMQYLVGHSNRASSIMVLHDLNLAARYAEHIILMNKGKVVASGKVGEVMRPDLLESVYGWQIRRCEDEAGFYFRS